MPSPTPKRFPDRDASRPCAPSASRSRPGSSSTASTRRLAGRAMARRGMGKLVFLDLVDLSGRMQVICDTRRTGEIDVHLGDVVGVVGRPSKSKRGEPSLAADAVEVLARNTQPLPDTFHGLTDVELRYRKRYLDLLMNEQTRADFVLRARIVTAVRALPRPRGLRRGRDAGAAAALRRRLRAAVHDPPQRARPGLLPPDRDRAVPQAADRRRASSASTRSARTSATRASRSSTTPSSRCSSGTRRTPTTATRWRASRSSSSRSRSRCSGRRTVTFRGHEIVARAARGARVTFAGSLAEHGLWIRDEADAARGA